MGTSAKLNYLHLTAVLAIYVLVVIISQWKTFSISYPLAEYERRYSQSQYVLGDRKTFEIGDGDIYTYAGIRYAQGEDPTKINFEHPPLIKYAFGLSYLLFGQPNWALVPLFFIAGLSFAYISASALKSNWARWLALCFFLGHSTIYMAIPQTMLDFPMTAILLLTTALFIIITNHPALKSAIFFGISAGALLVSKYPYPLLAMYIGLLILWLILNKISFKYLITILISLTSTYFLTYLSYFIHSHSLIEFLKFEWWRWQWFQGKTDSPRFMLIPTIFLGKYPKWWDSQGGYIYISHWNLFWPISVLMYLASWIIKIKPIREPLFPYKLWIILTLCIYMIGAAGDRFLIPLIPGFALFGTQLIETAYRRLTVR